MQSPLRIPAPIRSARASAKADFPDAVGPMIAMMSVFPVISDDLRRASRREEERRGDQAAKGAGQLKLIRDGASGLFAACAIATLFVLEIVNHVMIHQRPQHVAHGLLVRW